MKAAKHFTVGNNFLRLIQANTIYAAAIAAASALLIYNI
jgi:hypothetical protein